MRYHLVVKPVRFSGYFFRGYRTGFLREERLKAMKKDPKLSAQQVLKAMGGEENILSVSHCATRLRLAIKNPKKVNKDDILEAIGVAGYFEKNGQHQVFGQEGSRLPCSRRAQQGGQV